ncbi:DUF1145 domain-containing protein [Oceanicoccus sagamiensis]|uniref:DUF1145 domain-containing protein n=1 Tax=Oceanicoccus sagamiensis TaxID=716816 RepID=A0A1X9NDF7_9GAMM|nr:DUF1145 domain-containing protein [Oceanicoccus sagamiensis]ARN75191.1 hypothetical protein BST96_14345 [Oceanicoccus sagamiensis]
MNSQVILIGKLVTSVMWVLIVVAVIQPAVIPFATILQWVGGILLVAHCIEIVVYRRLMRGVGDYLGVLLFGVLQLKSIR